MPLTRAQFVNAYADAVRTEHGADARRWAWEKLERCDHDDMHCADLWREVHDCIAAIDAASRG